MGQGEGFAGVTPLPSPTYTGRTSFGINQGDQRKETADALEKKARDSQGRFLRQTEEERALQDTADKMRER
jgi:hypothetical protein